ncbi:MAG: AAA family ATPase [Burkholderiales bacterium]|nr:AAA family ATPase [Burkholderiales bacterium]
MPAKIIVITNQKGGCGKTTVTMNLVPAFVKNGFKVLIVDGDPQGTATRWASAASDNNPYPAPVIGLSNTNDKAHNEIKKHIHNYDYIIVDCPPAADSEFSQSALLVADLALVPIKPTPPDLWAAVGIKKVINSVLVQNENLISKLVISMRQTNSMNNEVLSILKDFGIEMLNSNIFQRTAYTQASLGTSVLHLKDPKAIAEISGLYAEIIALLKP